MRRITGFVVVLLFLSVLPMGCLNVIVGTSNNVLSISPTEKTIVAGESVTLRVTAGKASITWHNS